MSQLLSLANFDRQTQMNSDLSSLVSSMNSLLTGNGIGCIGQTIEAKGDTTTLTNGPASQGCSLSSTASNVAITVEDQDQRCGLHDHRRHLVGFRARSPRTRTTNSGGTTAVRNYTISVNATNASSSSMLDYTSVISKVTGVDSTSGTSQLLIRRYDCRAEQYGRRQIRPTELRSFTMRVTGALDVCRIRLGAQTSRSRSVSDNLANSSTYQLQNDTSRQL